MAPDQLPCLAACPPAPLPGPPGLPGVPEPGAWPWWLLPGLALLMLACGFVVFLWLLGRASGTVEPLARRLLAWKRSRVQSGRFK